MARVKGAMMTRKRRNKVLKLAKGYWGAKSKHFKMANQQVMKSLSYAYTGRRLKKRDFRQLWITRISAACKLNGMNYSTFMHGLKAAGVEINRKMLAELAVNNEAASPQRWDMPKKAPPCFSHKKGKSRPGTSGPGTAFHLPAHFSISGSTPAGRPWPPGPGPPGSEEPPSLSPGPDPGTACSSGRSQKSSPDP